MKIRLKRCWCDKLRAFFQLIMMTVTFRPAMQHRPLLVNHCNLKIHHSSTRSRFWCVCVCVCVCVCSCVCVCVSLSKLFCSGHLRLLLKVWVTEDWSFPASFCFVSSAASWCQPFTHVEWAFQWKVKNCIQWDIITSSEWNVQLS